MDKQIKPVNKSKKNTNLKTTFQSNTDKGSKKDKPITDWFYMTPMDVTATMVSVIMKSNGYSEVELWEEMNILQIVLKDNKTIDFEPVGYQFKDPSDAAFIKNRNIKTIFAVTVDDGALDNFKPLLKIILEETDGFLCADSVDFKPIYTKTDL